LDFSPHRGNRSDFEAARESKLISGSIAAPLVFKDDKRSGVSHFERIIAVLECLDFSRVNQESHWNTSFELDSFDHP